MKPRDETIAVKKALAEAGIKAKVGHSQGTFYNWLDIEISGSTSREAILQIIESATKRPSKQIFIIIRKETHAN